MRGRWRGIAAAVAAALALGATGCGGSAGAAGGEGAAAILPAKTPVYVSVDTDLSSDQWQTVDKLLDKFPGKQQFLTQLRTSFESDAKVSWEKDVKPALGDELDVAVLDLSDSPTFGILVKPKDAAKFDALVQKLNAQEEDPADKAATADLADGWKVVSDTQEHVAAFQRASGDKLADDRTFQDATDALADDALVKAYANGPEVAQRLKQAVQQAGTAGASIPGLDQLDKLRWASADVVASDDGTKLDAHLESSGGKGVKTYTPKLIDDVPSGALAYLSFSGAGVSLGQVRQALQSAPGAARQFGQIFEQLVPAFGNENALYVRGVTGIPEVTFIATPDDPQKAVGAVDKLVAKLTGSLGAPVRAKPVQIEGATGAKELNLGRFSVFYGLSDDKLVVTDAKQAFASVKSGGQGLSDDPTFKEAQKVSGMPSSTSGFLYVNLKDSVPLLESLAQLSGSEIPPNVSENLKPLRTFTAYGSGKGDRADFAAFLEVK